MFRLFGSPYTSGFHQCLTYLRLKQRYPYKLYCSSYLSTILYATFYKSRTMGTQTPAFLNGMCGERENGSRPLSHEKNASETMAIVSPSPTTHSAGASGSTPPGAGHTVCHVWDLEELVEGYEQREQRVYARLEKLYAEGIGRKVRVQAIMEASSSSSQDVSGPLLHGAVEEARGGGGAAAAPPPPHSRETEKDAHDNPRTHFLSSPKAPPGHRTPPSATSSSSRVQIPFHTLFPHLLSPSEVPPPPCFHPLRLDRRTHPRLYQLQWALSLYTYWWLGKTSLLYRFVLSESHEVIAGLLYYFLMVPAGGRAMTHMVAPFAKKAIGGPLASTGVSEASSPYMVAHFQLLTRYLEAHFAFQAEQDAAVAEERAMAAVHREAVHHVEWTAEEGVRAKKNGDGGNEKSKAFAIGNGEEVGHQSKEKGTSREEAASTDGIHLRSRFLLGTPHPLLCDVLLGAVFSSVFLMDDTSASFLRGAGADEKEGVEPSRPYPYLVNYVQRVTGWTGDWLPEEERRGGGGGSDPTSSSSFSSPDAARASFPDVIPERLLGVLELIEEVLPFLLSQVASLQAFMADAKEGWLRLAPHTVDGGPWMGCKGRILPALSPLESLMMVDSCLLTVRSRAFDLELALRAGRALWEQHHEKEKEQAAEKPHTIPASAAFFTPLEAEASQGGDHHHSHAPTAPPAVSSTAHRVFTHDATEDLLRPCNPDRPGPSLSSPSPASSIDGKEEDGPHPPTTMAQKAGDDAMEKKRVGAPPPPRSLPAERKPFGEEEDGGIALEEADFYRAFTHSLRHRERLLKRKAAVEAAVAAAEARSPRGHSPVTEGRSSPPHTSLLLRADPSRPPPPSMEDRLGRVFHRVTSMIRQMHCPNYTIATVPYKRRYVSVILPEHEACRARERRMQEDQLAEEHAVQEILRKISQARAEKKKECEKES